MEDSKLIESESATVSAPLKRQGDDGGGAKMEKKKRKVKSKRKLPVSDFEDVLERHRATLKYDPEEFVDGDLNYWEVLPYEHYIQKQGISYGVNRKMKGKCGWGWRCDYYCRKCKKCAHQFTCTCEDGKEGNMCEHIHLVCRQLTDSDDEESQDKADESKEESEEDEEEDDDETDQRNASSITCEMDELVQKLRDLVTGKKKADILIQSLKAIVPLLEKKKKEDNSQK